MMKQIFVHPAARLPIDRRAYDRCKSKFIGFRNAKRTSYDRADFATQTYLAKNGNVGRYRDAG